MAKKLVNLIEKTHKNEPQQHGWDGIHPDELIEIDGILWTEDQILEVLGSLVEKHPIVSAGIRRS